MANNEEIIKEHEKEITKLYVVTERIAEAQERVLGVIDSMSKDILNMSKSLSKQEVILEKLATTNEKLATEAESRKEGDARLHKRVDANAFDIKQIQQIQTSTGCPTFRQAQAKYDEIIKQSVADRLECKEKLEANKKDFDSWRLNLYIGLTSGTIVMIGTLIYMLWEMRHLQ